MNKSRHTSLSQTMAQMRRRNAARSTGGSGTPYTPSGMPPVADAGADQTVELDLNTNSVSVNFDGSNSYDPDDGTNPGDGIVSYAWDFGDGDSSTDTVGTSSHTYTAPGTYTVELTVTDNEQVEASDTMTVAVKVPPVADAGADQTVELDLNTNSVSVNFDGSNSYDPDDGTNPGDGIVSYAWDFGDGDSSTDTVGTSSHTYTAPGTYTVELTVTDNEQVEASDTMTVAVKVPPVADAGADQTVELDLNTNSVSVNFDGSNSYDPDDGTNPGDGIVSYAWDFGDGDSSTDTVGTSSHTYTAPGKYTVELTVTDDEQVEASDTMTVAVKVLPVADAGADQTVELDLNTNSVSVNFDGSNSYDPDDGTNPGDGIVSYAWDFGDGDSSTDTVGTSSHTYTAPGTYTVELTVTDDDGHKASDSLTVTVSEPIVLTLTGSDSVTRGDTATYTASITPAGLTLDTTPTFRWKYTTIVFRSNRNSVRITESIDATSENPQTTTWSGAMVSGGTLEVRTTVNGTEYVQTMNVTVTDRAWVTEVPITTDTTSWGTEAPGQHSDLGDVEYDMPFTPADDLETAEVSSGPNKGILYTASLNLTAPFIVRINRHFGMAEADLPPCWVAFKEANTRYGEIEAKVKARLGFDGTISGTLYGSWEDEIHYSDPKANLEEFMEVPGGSLSDYEGQIELYLSSIGRSRIAGMDRAKSGWRPSGITINYNYFAVDAGEDQTTDLDTAVNFDGSASCVPSGRTIESYSWNFGSDATPATGTGVSPSCTYSTYGEKTVTLTVTDSDGNTDSDTMTVAVEAPPVAVAGDDQTVEFDLTSNSVRVGFNGSHSYDPDDGTNPGDGIVSYKWDFGDGSTDTGPSLSHTYTALGTYTVELTVTDNDNETDIDTLTVAVKTPPVAIAGDDKEVYFNSTANSVSVDFDGSDSYDPDDGTNPGDGIVRYDWSFGDEDDSTGTGATPSHTYTSPGIYEVTLTVTDDENETGCDTMTVTVVSLTLTGSDTVTRGDTATYTASITPAGLSPDTTLTFEWKYTSSSFRSDRDPVCIEKSIDATSENPQTTTWSGTMVSGGTLEVRATVYGTELVQTMDVTVNKRAWVTDVPICTDTTSLGAEAPRSHTDLGNVEYDILFSRAHDLETATVSSGPNKGILYTTTLNLTAPLIVKINRHFRMAVADFPPTWVAFKNANTRYGEIETKVKARLGFDGTTSGTLYGSWVSEIGDNDPETNIEEFMEVPSSRLPYFDNEYKKQYEDQIVDRVEGLRTSRKAGMARRISGWSPTGITIDYNYFAARAGKDQTVDVNTEVIIDGSASFTLTGRTINDPSGYSWNFGSDADPATSVGKKPRCTYSTTGEKTVTLTVTDSEGDTACDTMIVTVEELSKRHPDIPVGMMGIQDKQLTELEETFQSVYVGDDKFSHPACNYLHSYGLDFNTSTGWGLLGVPLARPSYERHAIAWANFVGSVKDVNNRLGGAKLRCLISNRLMHMKLVLNWSLEDISRYVRHTIEKIDDIRPTSANPNPKDIVAGWYLSDDGLSPRKTNYTVANLSAVVHAVHSAQKACCVNWPFYFADNIDDRPFWNEAATQFTIPQKLKEWVRAFPPDATPIFMPYYYPWLSNSWRDSKNPPWKKWKLYIEKLHEAFFNPDGTHKIHGNLKFHPVLDASQQLKSKTDRTSTDLELPGHADMHKQVRVVWNLLQEYDSVTGMWFLGWNIDDGVATSRATAHNNWTENRKWAEAIQNEPNETEGIREAIPNVSKLYPGLSEPVGIRIPYSLSERKRFEIRIYNRNMDEDSNAKLVRTLDEGYDGVSPQGEYRNSPLDQHPEHVLRGTSTYWDGGYWDSTTNEYKYVTAGSYFAYLYLDGTRVHGPRLVTISY